MRHEAWGQTPQLQLGGRASCSCSQVMLPKRNALIPCISTMLHVSKLPAHGLPRHQQQQEVSADDVCTVAWAVSRIQRLDPGSEQS